MNKIFVPDPEMRMTIQEIKQHFFFREVNWRMSMQDRFASTTAPIIPEECKYSEADENPRDNLLAALFDQNVGLNDGRNMKPQKLSFDEDHFQKFLKEDQQPKEVTAKRKRQNPLGDFRFKRINE